MTTQTLLTFTGEAPADWPGDLSDGPDPAEAGCTGVVAFTGGDGAALLVRWDGQPNAAYLEFLTGRATAAGLAAGAAAVGPDAHVREYSAQPAHGTTLPPDQPLKGVPCIMA